MKSRRGRWVAVGAGALIVATMGMSAAWACVSLATIELSPGRGAVGSNVTGKASGFVNDPTYSRVDIHWGGVDGPILTSVDPKLPGFTGTAKFSFKVPDGTPGTYAVVATQTDEQGVPISGSPARATFTVPGAVAGVAPTEPGVAQETVKIKQQHVRAAAIQAPGTAVPLELRDAIGTNVVPSGSRTATYVPLLRNASNSFPAQAGVGLVVIGIFALFSSVAVVMVTRSARAGIRR